MTVFVFLIKTPSPLLVKIKSLDIFFKYLLENLEGSITLLKSNKWQARYKGKHIGCYNTEELAEEALKKIINN